MAWSQADIDAVRAAVVALATGKRTVSLSYAGRSVTYGTADLPDLEELLAKMERSASSSPMYRLAKTSKGL